MFSYSADLVPVDGAVVKNFLRTRHSDVLAALYWVKFELLYHCVQSPRSWTILGVSETSIHFLFLFKSNQHQDISPYILCEFWTDIIIGVYRKKTHMSLILGLMCKIKRKHKTSKQSKQINGDIILTDYIVFWQFLAH